MSSQRQQNDYKDGVEVWKTWQISLLLFVHAFSALKAHSWDGQTSMLKLSPTKIHHKSIGIMHVQRSLFALLPEMKDQFQPLHLLRISVRDLLVRLAQYLAYISFVSPLEFLKLLFIH
jgi:hypothetical protein